MSSLYNAGTLNNKRSRLDYNELQSAGMIPTGEESYIETNVVNLSVFDGTPKHGLPATFNQNRTTQIIPNTSRSEVGIVRAEIQTKTLPILQPQVKLGTDPDTLIYEVGLSAVWSGCVVNQSIANEGMAIITNDTTAQLNVAQTCGAPTFMGDSSATTTIYDSYGDSFPVNQLLPSNVDNTLLKVFIDFHLSLSSPIFANTPLKPVCIPSVFEPILFMAPLRTEANHATITANYVVVNDSYGFQVGDVVRLFGTYDLGGSSVDIPNYVTIQSICLYSDLIVSGSMTHPGGNTYQNITTKTCLVFQDLGIMAAADKRTGGYVINTRIDSRGGKLQFLTDQFEFRPRTVTLISSSNFATANTLTVTLAGTLSEGFLRTATFTDKYMKIELSSTDQPELNGIYRVLNITGGSSPYTVTLQPIGKCVLTASYTATTKTGVIKLASNGYTVDCSTPTDVAPGRIQFLNALGFKPTKKLEICDAAYPPVMTQTKNTWKRAYSIEVPVSVYKNIQWQTQDIDITPNAPIYFQDYGTDSGSSYYNVYDFQQFISQCVNPCFEKLIGVNTDQALLSLDDLTLNTQLDLVTKAYQQAFTQSEANFAYNSNTNYSYGNTVIADDYVWTVNKLSVRGIPPALNSPSWIRIGVKPRSTALANNLVFSFASGKGSFVCTGVTTTPEPVRLARTPKFKTKAPIFHYDSITGLIDYTVDTHSFGETYPYQMISSGNVADKFSRDIRNSNYFSWGYKNATDNDFADETFIIESNSSFKFLFDNFPASAVSYIEPSNNSVLVYWLWSQYTDASLLEESRKFIQASESLTSCASPIEAIVILSKTVPVVQTLLSPGTYVSDINSTIVNSIGTVGDSDSILGEFYIEAGMLNSCRSVIRYQPEQPTFYSLQSTKVFKQFDYVVCYRHRITQRLVPLNISNYGTINIKFVFKPI